MRNLKSVGVALLCSMGLAALVSAPVAAATSKGLKITDVTVTAAKQAGYSAVSMSITDEAGSPVTLTQVTSSVSGMSMMYFDVNMCRGEHRMTWLSNVIISSGHVQKLGYRDQGAMFANLHSALRVGETVPIKVAWSNFADSKVVTVMATVVAPPKGLHFLLSPMSM